MTAFTLEVSETDPNLREVVCLDDTPQGGRHVLFSAENNTAHAAMVAVRRAYNQGRKDEASIRAAAFRGLAAGAPFSSD